MSGVVAARLIERPSITFFVILPDVLCGTPVCHVSYTAGVPPRTNQTHRLHVANRLMYFFFALLILKVFGLIKDIVD